MPPSLPLPSESAPEVLQEQGESAKLGSLLAPKKLVKACHSGSETLLCRRDRMTGRAAALAADLRVRAVVVAPMREAGSMAAELTGLDARRRAALTVAGAHDPRPPTKELAAEIAHGLLAPLRPHVPFVTSASTERSAEGMPGCVEGVVSASAGLKRQSEDG